jgi:hypothetical protein
LRRQRAKIQRQQENQQERGTLYIMLTWTIRGFAIILHFNPVSATITDL